MEAFFMRYILLLTLTFLSMSSHGKLLDKISAVFEDQIITSSMIKRVKSNLRARKSISPVIYNKVKYTDREIINLIFQKFLVRNHLEQMGYVISNDQVEGQIKNTEKRLNLTRDSLLNFLRGNNMKFKEYFEITRETIEYMQLFIPRVLNPLISITDQEIKNRFFKENSKDKSLSFKYSLVDFSISKSKISKKDLKEFKQALINQQKSGILPEKYKNISINILDDITEDGLTKSLKKELQKSEEGSFSNAVSLNNDYHLFFVKKKDLVESEKFLKEKNNIKGKIHQEKLLVLSKSWFERELSKHFIKINL